MALAVGLLSVVLLGAACGDDASDDSGSDQAPDGSDVEVPDREPDLVGTVTRLTPFEPVTDGCLPADEVDPDAAVSDDDPPICTPEDSDLIGTLLVEGDLAPERGRKISYTVTTASKITGQTVDGVGVAVFADFGEGQTVDTWATGPCAESYPEQCTLEAIRVIG